MFNKIDDFFIRQTQKLVDLSGKKPRWISAQLIILYGILTVIQFALNKKSGELALGVLITFLFWFDIKRVSLREYQFNPINTAVRVFSSVFTSLIFIPTMMTGIEVVDLKIWTFTLLLHVMACQDPPPPRKRTSLAPTPQI